MSEPIINSPNTPENLTQVNSPQLTDTRHLELLEWLNDHIIVADDWGADIVKGAHEETVKKLKQIYNLP